MGYLIGIGISLLVVFVVAGVVIEQNEWDRFAISHKCKLVGKMTGSSTTAVGIGANGSVSVAPVFVPGKEGYQCDDGVTYWR